jgi:hypothetical protein
MRTEEVIGVVSILLVFLIFRSVNCVDYSQFLLTHKKKAEGPLLTRSMNLTADYNYVHKSLICFYLMKLVSKVFFVIFEFVESLVFILVRDVGQSILIKCKT